MRDCELLREFADNHSDAAFAELVSRHVNLVYSTACRMVGDSHLAKDVSQMVFIGLARKPYSIRQPDALAGWLYGATRLAAGQILRTETRRRNRETQAMTLAEPDQNTPAAWTTVGPLLDEAMSQLKPIELNAVVLRFFEGKSLEETGRALDLSENAAQKRVANALEKLRVFFLRRGVTVSSALLTNAIVTNSVQAAPTGLAASVTGASLANAVGSAAAAGSLAKSISAVITTKAAIAAAILVVTATTIIVTQQHKISRLQSDLAAAQLANSSGSAGVTSSSATALADPLPAISKILDSGKSQTDLARDLLEFFASLKPADLPALLDAYGRSPHNVFTDLAKSLLVAQWAKYDPTAALAWVKANVNDSSNKDDFISVFQSWVAEDSTAAFAALNQVDDPVIRGGIRNMLLAWMSQHDPRGAFAILRKLPLGQQTPDAYGVIFLTWAGQDPAAASAAVLNLPPSLARSLAIPAVATAWAEQDPRAALAWASSLPASIARTGAIGSVLAVLTRNDPRAASNYLDYLPNGTAKNELIQNIASNWALKDPTAALAWAQGVASGQVQDKAVEGILAQISFSDPVSAAGYLAKISGTSVIDVVLPQLATTWAQKDIQGALTWAQSLPASYGDARGKAYQSVLKTWIQTDPVGAAAYVQTASTDPNFKALTEQVAKSWANADPQAALAWIQKLPAGDIQTNALQASLIAYASIDPQAAWDSALAMPDDSSGTNYRLRTLSHITEAWSEQDPAHASTLIPQIPQINNSLVAIAAQTVASNWVKHDPEAASQWVNSLPDGGIRDHAVYGLITVEGKNDPATAFKWARSMRPNSGGRLTMVNTAIQEWAKSDPAAAAKAVQAEPNMTDNRRTELLNMISRNAPNAPDNADSVSDTSQPAP